MKLDILVFGAHPDDAELGAGATIAKEIFKGSKVGVIDLTRGELGTRGTATIRAKEAAEAAAILGLTLRENLDFSDGFLVNDKNHQLVIIETLRKYRPDLVICNAVDDRHIDHAKAADLVSDSCFLSGLIKIETFLTGQEKPQEAWRPRNVYHYIQWKNLKPDLIVDVSGHIETKMKAIAAYASQFYDPDSTAPETPISSKNFTESVVYRARDLGRLAGVEHGEGFTVERCIAVDRLGSIF